MASNRRPTGGFRNAKGRQLWAFVIPKKGFHHAKSLKLKVPRDHPDYDAVCTAIGGTYIRFREGRYVTAEVPVARFMRELVRAKRIPGMAEDLSMFPLKCQHCDFTLPTSGDKDKEKMTDHLYDNHPAELGLAPVVEFSE